MVYLRNLSKLAIGTNGFNLFHYRSCIDTIEEVMQDGYFDDAVDRARGYLNGISEGDWIMVTATNGSKMVVVTDDNGHVTSIL